jgi:hypothetical protein
LGGGESGGVGFFECDEAAGELEEGEVVLVFLAPADEQSAVAVQPRVGGLDDPSPCAPAGGAQLQLDLLAARADVRREAVLAGELVHRRRVVAAVQAQPLRLLDARLRPGDRDRGDARR